MRRVPVSLGQRSYHILVGSSLLQELGRHCSRFGLASKCAIISDSKVAPRFGSFIVQTLTDAGFDPRMIVVPAGERSKKLAEVERCYLALAKHRLERKSFVIALGGGVVGDLAGFVAATYLRGIPFVQIPTTLLAQVDSSVGGKVGVNLPAGKNLVGAFYQPRLVLCDSATLEPLPEREFRAGLAEVIKYGIIYDAPLFRRLERDLEKILARDKTVLEPIIARCCAIKAEVVGQDEMESGLRAILNFGHTIGHALEAISKYGRWLHGEAISIGQVAAAEISAELTGLPTAEVDRIRLLFERAGLPVQTRLNSSQRTKLFDAMRLDKKTSGGEVKFVLAKRIGQVIWGQKVPMPVIRKVLDQR